MNTADTELHVAGTVLVLAYSRKTDRPDLCPRGPYVRGDCASHWLQIL